MKLRKLSAALFLAGCTTAFANVNLGNLNAAPSQLAIAGVAGFSSGYDFSLSNTSSFSASLFGWNMSSLTLVNNNNGWNYTQSFTNSTSASFAYNLGAGNYSFYVNLLPFGSFGGTAGASTMAMPVPEAQNYAMLLVGIAGVSLTAMRRRRGD